MSQRDAHGLFEALPIRSVEVSGQSIHEAFGRPKQAQHAGLALPFGELVDRLFSDRDGAGREIDPIAGSRMPPMALLLLETERRHLFERQVLVDPAVRAQRGFPARLGRRRSLK